jgi:hypothetical protein
MEPVPASVLSALAALRPMEPPRAATSAADRDFDVRAWLRGHDIGVRREKPWINGATVLELVACVFNPEHNRGEAAVIQLASGMVLYTCRHQSCAGKAWADVRELIDGSRPRRSPGARRTGRDLGGTSSARAARSEAPWVQVNDRQLRAVADECLQVLTSTNCPPVLFARGTQLVRIIHTAEGVPVICIVGEAHLRNQLAAVIDFYAERPTGQKVECAPPVDVVRAILAYEEWKGIPLLQGLTETPTLRPDGSILQDAGYDPATRLVYVPSPTCVVPAIPVEPSAAQRAEALAVLDDVIADFPFVDDASRANAMAALLTPLVQQVVAAPIPLALIDKPVMGTGASLFTEVVSVVATGRSAATLTAPTGRGHEEEWKKVLTATLLDGATTIVIDNIEYELRSAALDKAISGHRWKDRVLGFSQTVEMPLHLSWYATGNNVRLGGTLPRRVYWVRLASLEAEPWKRDPATFRHPDLLSYVGARRGNLIAAGLTLARAWFVEGCPVSGAPRLGGFQTWVNVLHGILATAGVDGFMANEDDVLAQLAQEGLAWTVFISAWSAVFKDTPKRVCDLVTTLRSESGAELRAALPGTLADALERDRDCSQRFGLELQKRRDQVFPDCVQGAARLLRLEKTAPDAHSKVARWAVRELPVESPRTNSSAKSGGGGGAAGTCGDLAHPTRGETQKPLTVEHLTAGSVQMSPQLPAVPADLDRPRAPDHGADGHGDAEAQDAGNGTDPITLGPRNSTSPREPGEDDVVPAGVEDDWETFP